MLLHVQRALEKCAPDLHLVEVEFFPERPARVLDVERTGARQHEHAGLQVAEFGNVVFEEVEGAVGEAGENEAFDVAVGDGAGGREEEEFG